MEEFLKRYTHGEYKSCYRYTQAKLEGKTEDWIKTYPEYIDEIKIYEDLMKMVSDQPITETPLFRIESKNIPLKPGDEFMWGIRSVTKDPDFADKVMKGEDEGLRKFCDDLQAPPTFYEIIGKKRVLDISGYSEFRQEESIIFGRFRVLSVISPEACVTVQKETFEEVLKKYRESFVFFTSKSGKEMVKFCGKDYRLDQISTRTFYNGTLNDWRVEGLYNVEQERKYKRVIVEQII